MLSSGGSSLRKFIYCFAQKIATTYHGSYCDTEDYIQTGHLTLTKLLKDQRPKRDFQAYARTVIARDMRNAALDSMCCVTAPRRVKKIIHRIIKQLAAGYTVLEICDHLQIRREEFDTLQSLAYAKSWERLFQQPTCGPFPYPVVDDMLLSSGLTDDEIRMINERLDGTYGETDLSRKQKWSRTKNVRPKLTRGGYGPEA